MQKSYLKNKDIKPINLFSIEFDVTDDIFDPYCSEEFKKLSVKIESRQYSNDELFDLDIFPAADYNNTIKIE